MRSKRGMVIDGRGSPHKVKDIDVVLKETGIKRRVLIQKGDTKSVLLVLDGLAISWALFIVCLCVFYYIMNGSLKMPLVVSLGISIALLVYALMYSRVYWRSREHGMRAILRVGRCPSCLYELDGVPTEADGCTVCPECGGAWGIER